MKSEIVFIYKIKFWNLVGRKWIYKRNRRGYRIHKIFDLSEKLFTAKFKELTTTRLDLP